MKFYRQKQPKQGKLRYGMNIFVLGIVSAALGGLPVAGIIMFYKIKKMIAHDMPIFMKAPSNYRKSYRFLKIGETLSKVGLWLSVGFTCFWLTYILFFIAMFVFNA